MIRKTLMLVVTAITMLAVSVGGALAFTGDWYYDDNVGGWEVLRLGDNSDDTFLHLSGATEYCSRPGVSYAKMRNVLVRNGTNGEQIEWWVNASCGDFVRICVRNWRGEQGCSTYWSEGWKDWY